MMVLYGYYGLTDRHDLTANIVESGLNLNQINKIHTNKNPIKDKVSNYLKVKIMNQ